MRLYDTLNQHDKNLILKFGKLRQPKDHLTEECTFKPKINKAMNAYFDEKRRREIETVKSTPVEMPLDAPPMPM